jgi:hypothetical protein
MPFGNQAIKVLLIPVITDGYNYYMGAVNEFNYLTTQNTGLRYVERGGHQVLEYWLLRTVLINYYLLALYSNVPESREISFRSQQDFRRQLVSALVAKGRGSEICLKRRILQISQAANQEPINSYELIRMSKRGYYIACKGLRFGDRPRKRVAMSKIASNMGRESTNHLSFSGCKQCNVHLCKYNSYFERFHKEK